MNRVTDRRAKKTPKPPQVGRRGHTVTEFQIVGIKRASGLTGLSEASAPKSADCNLWDHFYEVHTRFFATYEPGSTLTSRR